MKTSFPRNLLLCAFGCAAFAMPAKATLILEETFYVNVPDGYVATGYTPESRVMQSPGAILSQGFSGPWSTPNSSDAQSTIASTTQLNFGSLLNQGTGSLNIWNAGNYSRATRRGMDPFPETDTIWFTTLINVNSVIYENYQNNVASLLYLSDVLPGTSLTGHAAVWSSTNGGGLAGFGWGLYAGDIAIRYQTDAGGTGFIMDSTILGHEDYQPDTTYLLISKLTLNVNGADDNMQVWALTSVPQNEMALGVPNVDINANIVNSTADFVNFYANFGGGGNRNENTATYFDAVRIGTTFDSVIVAIPEPTLLGMLALAGGVFFLRRSRLRKV